MLGAGNPGGGGPSMSDRTKYPARDDRRCDAFAKSTNGPWQCGPHRCGKAGGSFRDGRWVCGVHRDAPSVTYACGNHFEAYAEAMARALEPSIDIELLGSPPMRYFEAAATSVPSNGTQRVVVANLRPRASTPQSASPNTTRLIRGDRRGGLRTIPPAESAPAAPTDTNCENGMVRGLAASRIQEPARPRKAALAQPDALASPSRSRSRPALGPRFGSDGNVS